MKKNHAKFTACLTAGVLASSLAMAQPGGPAPGGGGHRHGGGDAGAALVGGIIGGVIGSAITAPPPPAQPVPPPPGRPVVVYAPAPATTSYASVADVQAALQHYGYYNGVVDGVSGPRTSAAIRSFQSNNGLPVTGYIDAPLLRALGF